MNSPPRAARLDRLPRVYLIAMPTVSRSGALPDLTPLAQFGEVTVLVTGDMNPLRRPANTADAIASKLQDFDPDYDFITAAGGATLAALSIGLVLGQMGMSTINWLSFQRGTDEHGRRTNDGGYYRAVRLEFGQGDDQLDLFDDASPPLNDEDTNDDG